MSDDIKELLTLAAKACGKRIALDPNGMVRDCSECHDPAMNIFAFPVWAPHLDDGDNSRMEGELRIDLAWCDGLGEVTALLQGVSPTNEKYADHNGDEQAARRWASLRAAAQEGRGMP